LHYAPALKQANFITRMKAWANTQIQMAERKNKLNVGALREAPFAEAVLINLSQYIYKHWVSQEIASSLRFSQKQSASARRSLPKQSHKYLAVIF